MLDDVKILSQKETQKPDDAGRYRPVIETMFKVGDDGPFYVCQDEATFDGAKQRALIEAKADAVRATRG